HDRLVVADGKIRQLTRLEFSCLTTLAARQHDVVSYAELIQDVYDGAASSENIKDSIRKVRRKLDDDPKEPSYIATIYSYGYRFIGNVFLHDEHPTTSMED